MNDIANDIATVQPIKRQSLVQKFAARYSVDPDKLLPALKATAFKVKNGEATNEQMMALMIVADQYGLNPWTKEIYAFPDKQGIIPVVGVDGWSRIINENPQFDGMDFTESETIANPERGKPCPEWIECTIYRKDRSHPIRVREYLDEVYRKAYQGNNGPIDGPWQTHTKRFLRHKAMIQCARIAFGFAGIYDQDEAERIIEGEAVRAELMSVTGHAIDVEKVDDAYVRAIEIVDSDDMDNGPDLARKLYLSLHQDEQLALQERLKSLKGGESGRKSYWSIFRDYYNAPGVNDNSLSGPTGIIE